ncbi:hypothetical protein [Actinoplanes solisilvae]|uniref:hypothetical protein n=1 Tax=Actinoplanes solisilvae TaxID=2486853 RepID=UPI000FDB7CFC|nr:hypothetical protein [Actinoplanes solisilvae]
MYRIALRVTGVDLDDDQTFDTIGENLSHLTWIDIDGRTVAVFHTDSDPVGASSQAARQIVCCLSGARVVEVDQDLVGVSDIAKRVGVTREAVRLWVEGKRGPGAFPSPVGSSGGGERGSQRLWQWASVNDWLRHYNLHDDEETLTAAQVAEVNASLHRVAGPIDREWRQVAAGVHARMTMLPTHSTASSLGGENRLGQVVPEYSAATAWHGKLSVRVQEEA